MWWFQGQDCFPTSCRTLSMALATFSSIFWIASCTLRLGDGAPNLHSNPLLIQHRWFCALRLDGWLPFWNKVGRTQNDKGEVRTAHPEVAISDPPGQMRMPKAFNCDFYRMFQVSNLEDAAPVTDTLPYEAILGMPSPWQSCFCNPSCMDPCKSRVAFLTTCDRRCQLELELLYNDRYELSQLTYQMWRFFCIRGKQMHSFDLSGRLAQDITPPVQRYHVSNPKYHRNRWKHIEHLKHRTQDHGRKDSATVSLGTCGQCSISKLKTCH